MFGILWLRGLEEDYLVGKLIISPKVAGLHSLSQLDQSPSVFYVSLLFLKKLWHRLRSSKEISCGVVGKVILGCNWLPGRLFAPLKLKEVWGFTL